MACCMSSRQARGLLKIKLHVLLLAPFWMLCPSAEVCGPRVNIAENKYSHDQDLAATPRDSRERFEARRLLPGMAKRIREVYGPRRIASDEHCY